MELNQIYRPIEEELHYVEKILETSLKESNNESILKLNHFLLESPGKRLRPALMILSTKATLRQNSRYINHKLSTINPQLAKIASAIELIHMASLIHDDVIDQADLRHHRPTVNSKWGEDVSIALGDYLYALAFPLISNCTNTDVLDCISSATKAMCEGELIQVVERDNLSLLKERYYLIVKKKTASLFVASCQVGAMLSNCPASLRIAFKEYGLNFGIAFQIIDDCLDLIGKEKNLGKSPGRDFKMGELTLPVLNLLALSKDRNRLMTLIRQPQKEVSFKEIRQEFIDSKASLKTKEDISFYIQGAKKKLKVLWDSEYRDSLEGLADFIQQRAGF